MVELSGLAEWHVVELTGADNNKSKGNDLTCINPVDVYSPEGAGQFVGDEFKL